MLSSLFPLLYGAIFVALLWQAFRVMGKGFRAASGPLVPEEPSDRTGRVTVHQVLDSEGRIPRGLADRALRRRRPADASGGAALVVEYWCRLPTPLQTEEGWIEWIREHASLRLSSRRSNCLRVFACGW